MWESIAKRRHRADKVFPAASGGDGTVEYMLFGSVALEPKTGAAKTVDWAGHARVEKDVDGEWKFAFYRVYLQL